MPAYLTQDLISGVEKCTQRSSLLFFFLPPPLSLSSSSRLRLRSELFADVMKVARNGDLGLGPDETETRATG